MKIFVYGTLKSDCSNHYILENKDTKYLSKCNTKFKYPMYKNGTQFPFLENQINIGNYIKGELFEIEEIKLIDLDKYESVPDLFKRGIIDIIDENGKEYKNVLVYFKSNETNLKNKVLIDEWKTIEFNFDDYYASFYN